MLRRILIGTALLAFLALAVVVDGAVGWPAAALLITIVAAGLAQEELTRTMTGGRCPAEGVLASAAVLATPVLVGDAGIRLALMAGALVGGTLLILAGETLRLQLRPHDDGSDHARRAVATVFSLAYVSAPLGFILAGADLRGGDGTLWAVVVVVIAKCGDIGGYLVGSLAGRHVMMARVSPKKSWEGSFGGLALTIGAVFCADAFAPQILGSHPAWRLVAFGTAVNLATQTGDFAESMLKRSWGVKDTAALVPTFGGALDIIDSLVFAGPVAFVFLWFTDAL